MQPDPREVMWSLDPRERISMLIVSVAETRLHAEDAMVALLGLYSFMAIELSPEARARFVRELRKTADGIAAQDIRWN